MADKTYRERIGCGASHDICRDIASEADAELAACRLRIAELEKDVARYRWLRSEHDDDFCFAVVKNPHFDVYESPEELDAAIDAAINSKKESST